MSFMGTIAPGPVKYAAVNTAAGDYTVVAAVTGKRIRVLAGMIAVDADQTISFEDGTGGTALTGLIPLTGDERQLVMPYAPTGHFQTSAGTLLNLTQGGTDDIDGYIVYQEVD